MIKRTKLHRTLIGKMDRVVKDYNLITSGDRILVAVSGGVDSMSLLYLLHERVSVYGESISLFPTFLDHGFSAKTEEQLDKMTQFFNRFTNEFCVESLNIGEFVHSEANRKNPCFLCTRLRRKRLFEIADANKCNKIAFGHHKDDIIETFLINVFYGREISTMVPSQSVFKGKFFLIRPLAYAFEHEVKTFAREQKFDEIPNECPTEPVSKRNYVKKLLAELEADYKGTKENIFKALKNPNPEYLL